MNPGDLTLKLATLSALVAFVAAVRWARGRDGSETTFRWAYHAMTALLGFASVLLMTAILVHDFRFDYVIGYSSRDLPLIYLISAFWAGQEGTYLLWALFGALVGCALFRRTSWERAAVMACYMPTIGFLLVLMLDPSGNPFRLAPQVPPDGRGLNPLLQDPWMASHPPAVFLGYAAATVPAVLALVAMLRGRLDAWLGPALRWSIVAFLMLGIGIILGGFWAYKTLGWGGFWGWDPVENASLVPWVVATALLHGLLVERASGALRRINVVLALATYLLVLYATFLTRSGVLANFSVHSFPAGSIYRILVGIMVVALGVAVWALVRRGPPLGKEVPVQLSWGFALTIVVQVFVVSAAIVLIGTSWPILSGLVGTPWSINPAFYNRTNLPLYVALLALLGAGPFLAWFARPWNELLARLVPSVAVAAAGTGVALALGGRGIGASLLFFTALLALTSNMIRVVEVGRRRALNTGAAVAHIGFALMFVGIVTSSAWGDMERVALAVDQPARVLDRTLTFRGHVAGSDPESRWAITVAEPGGGETTAEVTMYQLPGGGEQSSFRKPAILVGWTGDFYISPAAIDPGVLNVEVSTKPFIGVLWAGTILLSLGCGIAIARHLVDERAMRALGEASAARKARAPRPERPRRAVEGEAGL